MKKTPAINHNYLIKQLPKATAFVNEKFEVVHASDKWTKDFALDTGTVFGKSVGELFTSTNHDWQQTLSKCLSGTADKTKVDFNLDTYKLGDVWFEWSCVPWFDEHENIVGLIIQAEDITQRKLEEEQNKKLKSLLKATSEIGKIGSWDYCFKKDALSWCGMTQKIHEVSDSFVPTIENTVKFYKEGHSKNTISMLLHEATVNGTHWSERLQIITAKGNEAWVQASGMPLYDNGKLSGLTGTFQNIDDQVSSEIKTKESENLLRTLIDNLPLNVFIKDTESRKLLVNKSECAYIGVDGPEELLGKTGFELFNKNVAQNLRDSDLKVMDTLTPQLGKEITIRKKNGETTTFLTSKIPLMGALGKATGLIGISMDISDRKRKEEELQHIVNVASLQNKKLVNFAHIVSHNLRSHTANFSMLLDFLTNEKNESEKNRILDMLTGASDNLMETLENLNEVVDINTNINIDKEPIALKDRIDAVWQNMSGYLAGNKATLVNQVSDKIEVPLVATYIDNILLNFMTNAVKYKHHDREAVITMSAKSEHGYAVLSISDNGLGIDLKTYGHKLFGMYKTFHNHSDARGIGLFITKNQIEAMGGKVSVESTVGTGTTFKIYFNENIK